jgi:uncharacterized hydrophobic protein (TIGR00341 family)
VTLRLVQLLVAEEHAARAMDILRSEERVPEWAVKLSDGRVLIQTILPATGNEPVLDELEGAFRDTGGFRILFLPLEATLPRVEDAREEEDEEPGQRDFSDAEEEGGSKRVHARINREELYGDISEQSRATPYYLSMVALSVVVACAGLLLGDVAVIIGAMVIAPLIGPSMGIALATTLGDLKLGRAALSASFAGVSLAFVLSAGVGVVLPVDPEAVEIAGRTRLTWGHLTLALAAGAAGAVSLGQGVGAGLVGVMVSVALLPPLAAAGLLVGDGHMRLGLGALLLTTGNVVSVNLAATATFLIQGVRPNTWWEGQTRKRAVWVAALLWGGLLVALAVLIALV